MSLLVSASVARAGVGGDHIGDNLNVALLISGSRQQVSGAGEGSSNNHDGNDDDDDDDNDDML